MTDSSQADLDSLDDQQLLQRCRTGQSQALEHLIRRYQGQLLNFLARFCQDRALAEDVFQETFLQVYLSADTFDTSRRFKPWLFTIAANKARDLLRRRARRPAMSLDAKIGHGDDDQRFVNLMAQDMPLPSDQMENDEFRGRIQRVVASLPEHLREILLMAYFQKMSYGQIAEILEIPLGTVKSRLHSAVGKFAKEWKAANHEEEPT
jgi:RNA polymerase sigma-70 factor (ECF subfamily)